MTASPDASTAQEDSMAHPARVAQPPSSPALPGGGMPRPAAASRRVVYAGTDSALRRAGGSRREIGIAGIAGVALLAACGSSPAPAPSVSGALWRQGQYSAALVDHAAVLSHSVSDVKPLTVYATDLAVRPPGGAEVTTLKVDAKVTASSVTGDTVARAGIALLFQPVANRVSSPDDLVGALFARVTLARSAGGLVAARELFECTAPDCSKSVSVGTDAGAGWPAAGLPVAEGTLYTLSLSVDPATRVFTFGISGGALAATSQAVDASGVTSPFAVDASAANFHRASLLAHVRGGPGGGGDGSISAAFGNVEVGSSGAAAALFDDFGAGADFDPSKWAVGGKSSRLVQGNLQIALDQANAAAGAAMGLVNDGPTSLQADVTVDELSASGGRFAARLEAAIYNDGTNGRGIAPDTNQPGSQVGDVVAAIEMTDVDVSLVIVRCDAADCSSASVVQALRPLGAVTLGSKHALSMQWDPVTHRVRFQLDGDPGVTVDPVAAGFPAASGPRLPGRQIAVRADPEALTPTLAGSMTATFSDVKPM
jgi:hypothetical protein